MTEVPATPTAPSPLRALLRHRDFMRVWWAGLISWTGNGMLFIALPVYVYSETGSTLATALSVMAGALPMLLVGQVAGILVDRWDYRRTLVAANLALAGLTLIFLAVLGAPWWLVVVITLVQSSVGQVLGPAENAFLPALVPREHLGAAGSLNALNNNLARLLGPALGGLLIASVGFAGVVVLDALTYVAAALLVAGVRAPRVKREVTTGSPLERLGREWRVGLQAVRANHLLNLSFAVGLLVGLGEGTVSTLMAPFVSVMLGGGGRELGLLMSTQAVGGIAGGLLLTRFADRIVPIRLLGWGGLLSGVLLVPLLNYPLVYPVFWPSLVLIAVAGVPFTAFATAQMLLLQTQAEPGMRGRVFGAYFAVFGGAQLVGMAGSGVLGDRLGVWVINTQTVAYLLAGLIVLGVTGRGRHAKAVPR